MEKIERISRPAVSDSGPLIHLDELECLTLLNDFSQITVPEAVWREVQNHRPQALKKKGGNLVRTSIPQQYDWEVETAAGLFTLQNGEKEAIYLSHQSPNSLFLTDDTAARLAARSLGITVHGTIGILVRSIRLKHKSKQEVVSILRSLPQKSTLHIKRSLLDDIIREVLESV